MAVTVDGRTGTRKLAGQVHGFEGTYYISVPGKTANNISMSANDTGVVYSGFSIGSPYVEGMNTPPSVGNKSLTTAEDTQGQTALSVSDPDAGDTHYYQIVSGPSVGSATISGSTLLFTPPLNWNGSTSLVYRAVDSFGEASNNATVSIAVTPVNDQPLMILNGSQSEMTTPEDTAISTTLSVVDPDGGDAHTFELVSGPASGSVSISGARLTYTPAANWNGTASFTIRARDASGSYSNNVSMRVIVTPVNDAPVAHAKTLVTNEDTTASVALSGTDVDSPTPSVFQIVTAPNAAHGSVSLSGGTATFVPVANWHGSTSFTYRVQDSAGAWSAPVTVSVTVNPVNDVPVISDITRRTNMDVAKTMALSAIDPDIGDAQTFTVVQQPSAAAGSVAISGSTMVFTPAKGWTGTTSFTYQSTDKTGAKSNVSTVKITVVQLFQVISSCNTPVAGDDFRFVLEDAGESGLGLSSFRVDLDFGDGQAQQVPVTVQTQGTWVTGIVANTSAVLNTPAFAEGFNRANYISAANGGQKPYTFKVTAEAQNGQKRSHSHSYDPIVREDKSAPKVAIFAGSAEGNGDVLRSIDDVSITVLDDKTGVDPTSAQFYLQVGSKRVPFFIQPDTQSAVSPNPCVARYPLELQYTTTRMAYDAPAIMDDAYTKGLPVTLEVQVEDFAGNATTLSKTLSFAPDVLEIGKNRIPA